MYTSGTNLFSQPLAASTIRLEMEGDTREVYLEVLVKKHAYIQWT